MALRLLFALVLLIGGAAAALSQDIVEDPTRIAGGPRQRADAANCPVYEAVWARHTIEVESIPATYEYGPEALIPAAPADDTFDPEAALATRNFATLGQLQARYSGRGTTPPSLGYDQYVRLFDVASVLPAGEVVRLPMPLPERGTYGDPVKERAHRIRTMLWALSARRTFDAKQLAQMSSIAFETPTCGGRSY